MGVTITPLGFKKPDGNELVRGGDNVIADNAQKAEEVIAADRAAAAAAAAVVNARLSSVESAAFVGGGLLMEDPNDPGFFLLGGPE